MVFVLLSWIYISVLIFSMGFALGEIIKKICRAYDTQLPLPVILINGLFVTNIVSLFFGLLYSIGLAAHLFLIALSALCYFIYQAKIRALFGRYRTAVRNRPWSTWFLFLLILLVQLYAAYLPSSHTDDGLYYSPSIKWLQEYGTIPGLANVNLRIGFNSSWLAVQAIFGFPFLHAGLFNDMNGLFFLYVFLIFLKSFERLWKGDRSLYAYVSVMFFLPILFIQNSPDADWKLFNLNFFSSPSPDIPACLLTWVILLLLIQPEKERGNRKSINDFHILLYGAWILTIKLSSVAILIPVMYVLFTWVRQYSWRKILFSCVFILATLAPWIARNLLLTGYLVFPFPGADWFSFDWKVPLRYVLSQKNMVKLYAIDSTLDLNKPFTISVWAWLPGWFSRLPFITAVIVLGIAGGMLGSLGIMISTMLKKGGSFLVQKSRWIVLAITCITGIIFWLLNGPELRLGFGFCLFFVMLGCSWVCWFFLQEFTKGFAKAFFVVLLVSLFYNYDSFLNGVVNNFFVRPLTPRVASRIIETHDMGNGVKFQLVDYADGWNTPLPSAPNNEIYMVAPQLRGKTLKEGFRASW